MSDLAPILTLASILVAAGLASGLAAGLFGIGGGTVIVPALFFAFESLQPGASGNLHCAIGTSLAIIAATASRSLAAHRAHKAVDEAVLRAWTPIVAAGAGIGAVAAGFASDHGLALVYALAAGVVSLTMILGGENWRIASDLPKGSARLGIGGLIGALSALMGVGGGAMGSMLMTLCGRPIHQAIATASGFGMAIGLPAAAGFIVFGWGTTGRPMWSLGFVNLPGLVVMAILASLVAPVGARLAHRMDRLLLRRTFGLFLALTAIAIVWRQSGR